MLTTRPLLGASARADVLGSVTSTPPCINGAVIMKMMSSSRITSISDTTLMSALSGVRSPCVRRRTLDAPLAGHQRNDLRAEALELAVEAVEPRGEDVLGEGRGDRDGERRRRGDERLRHARGHGTEIPRPLDGHLEEGCLLYTSDAADD